MLMPQNSYKSIPIFSESIFLFSPNIFSSAFIFTIFANTVEKFVPAAISISSHSITRGHFSNIGALINSLFVDFKPVLSTYTRFLA